MYNRTSTYNRNLRVGILSFEIFNETLTEIKVRLVGENSKPFLYMSVKAPIYIFTSLGTFPTPTIGYGTSGNIGLSTISRQSLGQSS